MTGSTTRPAHNPKTGKAGEGQTMFDKFNAGEVEKLNQWLTATRVATTLTKKEEATNAAILQKAIDDDKPYEPKHIVRYLPHGSEGYSAEAIAVVYSTLQKTGTRYGYFTAHDLLLEMTVDRISRFASIRDWSQTLQGSHTAASTKTAACGLCKECKRRRKLKKKLNRGACLDVQTRTTPEYKSKPQPVTFKQWQHALIVECKRRDYVKNRGYLKSDDKLTYMPHEELFRFVGKPHSLRPLSELAATYVRLDCLTKEERNANNLCAASLDGLLDEIDESILLIKATARNRGTHGRGKNINKATPSLYTPADVHEALTSPTFDFWLLTVEDVAERIERINRIAKLREGQKLPNDIKPYPFYASGVTRKRVTQLATSDTRGIGETIPARGDRLASLRQCPASQDCTPREDHRVKWAKWAADNMVTDEKTAARIDATKKAAAASNSARPDEYGRTPAQRLNAARTRSEKRRPRRTDEKTLRALKAAKEHNEKLQKERETQNQH